MNKTIIYQAILYLHNHLYTYITISIYISIHLPIHKAIFLSIHLSIYLPLQPALSLSASLSYWSMSHYPVFIRFRLTAFLHSRAATLGKKDWERERAAWSKHRFLAVGGKILSAPPHSKSCIRAWNHTYLSLLIKLF